MYPKELVSAERLDAIRKIRTAAHDAYFENAEKKIGKEAAVALRELYSLYDERIYLWLAGLWDPEIGAFYYSESARDVEGFLPDIESTMQAVQTIEPAGLLVGVGGKFPKAMCDRIADFAIGLQDEDGFFYHPQWGKDITVSRRGRDLGWSKGAISMGGKTPRYPTPSDKKPEGESTSMLLPEHLRGLDAWREYLAGLDIKNRSYWVGNLLQSQNGQIKAAGDEYIDVLMKWYADNQNPENGTWQSELTYGATNGLMKVALVYSAFKKEFPNAETAANSAIDIILLEHLNEAITSFYNPWITISMLIKNLEAFGHTEAAERVKKRLTDNLPAMLRMTRRKVSQFAKPDGGFSYNITRSCPTSQGAPVAIVDTPEGDINGNYLSTVGVVRNVCSSLGLDTLPFYVKEDGELFFELIEKSVKAPKITAEKFAKRRNA